MDQQLVILGRQPALGLAELESLYGGHRVRAFGDQSALVTAEVNFGRIGGGVKAAVVIQTLPGSNWGDAERYLLKDIANIVTDVAEGKLQLGISAYGFTVNAQRVNATGLSLKKAIRKSGRSVRLSPNTEAALSSAQVFHNHLAGDKGVEIIVISDGQQTVIARTLAVQDIDSYTLRDRGRPKRDSRVGMLPPKLAQTIINLAIGHPDHETTVLDPFCGTGVLLQEALLMGYGIYGSDLEQRMIDYSQANLTWLGQKFVLTMPAAELSTGDATSFQWQLPGGVRTVACETYLGKPFTARPAADVLAQTVSECNTIIRKFLVNLKPQLAPDARLCIAVPAWQVRANEFKHLPLIDSLEGIGYNRVKFEHVRDEQLLYYREDQIVARQLLVITRN